MRKKRFFLTFLSVLLFAGIAYSQTPTANFTSSATSGCSPIVVNFQDLSTGNPSSWFWDFGNGATSTLKNPSTTYFTPGTYTVTLTATNVQGSNTLTRSSYITIFGKPSVKFGVDDSVGCFPHPTQFTDLSTASAGTNNNSWLWDFGDGTQSFVQNPSHLYTASGNFTVTAKVTNDKGCFAVLSKPAYIRINGGVIAGFTNSMTNVCKPPHVLAFTDTSTGPGTLTYLWDFGDGGTSVQRNPTHTYTTPGVYTVSLTTTSSIGCSDTSKKTSLFNFLNINTTINAPDSVCVNALATLQNTSVPNPSRALWNFGDGTTDTAINPVKIFTTPGTYIVRLTNTYSYCTDSASKVVKVLPRPVANFTGDSLAKCQPSLNVKFTDASANAVGWQWDFGDGGTSALQNPVHVYTSYGSFDVRLIVTNSSGCTDTLVKKAYIKIQKPVISFPGLPLKGCIPYGFTFSAAVNTLDVVTSYSWDFGDGTTATGPNPGHTYNTQGNYTVSVTITTSTGCTEKYTLPGAVLVGRRPVINFDALPKIACAFQSVMFMDKTSEGDEWQWNFGDGSGSTLQNPIHQYSDTGFFDVQLIVTNSGCKDSLKFKDFIKIKPPIAKFGFITNCDNRLLFAFRDSSVGATRWFWDFGDGKTDTVQHPAHQFPAYGSYTVKLTVGNDTCTHSTTQTIKVVNENPNFRSSDSVLCRVAQLQFFSLIENPSNIVHYQWELGYGGILSNPAYSSINYTYPLSGFYSVRLVTTDIYGCKDTAYKQNYIRVNGPTASFNANNNTGCKGLTAQFNDLSKDDGTSPIVSWRWDYGDGNAQTFNRGGSVQHTYPNTGSYTVKLVIRDAGGCRDSVAITNLVVTTDPKAAFSTTDTLSCPSSNVAFSNQSSGINYSSAWNFGDGNTSATGSPIHAYADTGNYTIQLVITDQYSCKDSITKPAYIKVKRPHARYTISDSISSCAPLEVKFTNQSYYYNSVTWNLGGGVSNAPDPIQYYFNPGVYNTSLIITSPGGCRDTAYKTIRIYDTVGTRIAYQPLDGCKPLLVDLKAFSPGPVSYTWDFGDGVIVNSIADTLRHIYNSFGDFVPKVIMTDPSGCVIPVRGPDTINIIGVTAKFGLSQKLFCDSGRVQFIDSTTFNDSLIRYTWNFGDGNTSNLQQPSHSYAAPGLYTVSLMIQTRNACVDTFTLPNVVKVVESPIIKIDGDSVICVNEFMNHLGIFVRQDTSAIGWRWRFPNNNTSTLQTPVKQQYTTAGNFVVQSIATNSSGCADTATKNILIHPLPVVTIPSPLVKQVGVPLLLPATYSSNTASYAWAPSNTLSCATCPQPETVTKFNTKYTVNFVDSNGCRNTGMVEVVVLCPSATVFVPNTFSPNGDGSNDVLIVRGKGLDRVKTLRIFNRWGEVVFEQHDFPVNNSSYGWDGTYKGKPALPDVYVYQVEVFCENSQIVRFEGNVALIQ